MRRLLPAFCFVTMSLGAVSAQAQNNPVVVELFTSQGCSSCPPADEMLRDLARMDGVIALALHVDYWDYIGWADQFAQPAFTQRQESYAVAAGERTVYTPQMMVGGLDPVIGADAMAVMDHIRAHAASPTGIALRIVRVGDSLNIRAEEDRARSKPLSVQIVRYEPEEVVTIERGENAGQTLTYVNIVTSWELVGNWQPGGSLSMDVPLTGSDPAVVIVQEPGPGRIMAAAVLR